MKPLSIELFFKGKSFKEIIFSQREIENLNDYLRNSNLMVISNPIFYDYCAYIGGTYYAFRDKEDLAIFISSTNSKVLRKSFKKNYFKDRDALFINILIFSLIFCFPNKISLLISLILLIFEKIFILN